ncbi:MAG: hypothetical protein MMC23_006325 [Stictis urceolatum]|nr:hypothetical protein [Stictis urceolata]
MPAQHVPPSATKTRLLNGLGLQVGNQQHEQIYLMIKGNAEQGYSTLCANRQNLKKDFENCTGRWQYNYVKDEAIVRAIGHIESLAIPALKQWYEHWGVAGKPRNFVIDWFLWHAFRNKDPRNKPKSSTSNFHADDDDNAAAAGPSVSHYDPVRDEHVPAQRSR